MIKMDNLLKQIRSCQECINHLPYEPRPIMNASTSSKIVIVGQAPGRKVHDSGIPWNDKSGEQLRNWMNVTSKEFYNPELFAIIPMGFCYPGKGKSGDMPPRPECAPLWHQKIFSQMNEIKLILLIGQYSLKYYLGSSKKRNLTETVKNYKTYLPKFFPLPHPSPRNRYWLSKNPWFEKELLPEFKLLISKILNNE